MCNLNMTYEEAKKYGKELGDIFYIYGNKLDNFQKNEIGLTLNSIKTSLEWKEAKQGYEESFVNLQEFNKYFTKTFKKEILEERSKNSK